MQEHIRQLFTENIQTMIATGEALAAPIESAALTIVHALINDRKVLCCGEGAARALASHFSQLLKLIKNRIQFFLFSDRVGRLPSGRNQNPGISGRDPLPQPEQEGDAQVQSRSLHCGRRSSGS